MSGGAPRGRRDLRSGSIPRRLVELSAPMLLGIVAIMAFNLVDTFYVSRLGTLQLAAISFTFPVVVLVGGLTLGLGVGLTAIVSQEIGAGQLERVRQFTRDGLLLALLVVAVFSAAGLSTLDAVFRALGADAATLPLVREYMHVWYAGVLFLVVPMVGNGAIRATGDTRSPALIMSAAALSNVILDPIFIFGWGPVPAMGLEGAALASVISRATTLVMSLWILIRRERLVALGVPSLGPMLRRWGSILVVGAPAAATNVLAPVSLGLLTRLVAGHGTAAVAGFGAGGRVQQLAMVAPIAWSSGLTPFVGQNWGAGLGERVRLALRFSRRMVLLGGVLSYAVVALAAVPLSGLFTREPEARRAMVDFLRLGLWGFPFVGMIMLATAALNALRRPLPAAVLNLLRLFGFLLPLAYAGSALLGLRGVYLSMGAANLLAGLIAWRWLTPIGGPKDQPISRVPAPPAG